MIALVEERFALVADGDKRRFDRPKRKNVLHLERIGSRSEEVANSLRDTGRVTNAKLRHAIGQIEQRLAKNEAQELNAPASISLEAHAEEKGE
ncbi:hypothetical protein [Cohnella boryungensis]|uniref:RNA-binding protein n=1 Tax=Cohnella boryungensis TaxID=768479 RepID=A0ABV8SAS5_9BACL